MFWELINSAQLGTGVPLLTQGDVLDRCRVPVLDASFGVSPEATLGFQTQRLIVLTQSCDLTEREDPNNPNPHITLCRLQDSAESFKVLNGNWSNKQKQRFDNACKGNRPDVHVMSDWARPNDPEAAKVAHFRMLFSLPLSYIRHHAQSLTAQRPRLRSPYREHFSQAYARLHMRVGLPTDVPKMMA